MPTPRQGTVQTHARRRTLARDRTILKPLPSDKFVDYREGGGEPVGATRDQAVNAETRWEAMAEAGYLTPNELFFVRSHASTPRIDRATWALRVVGPGIERELAFGYEDLLGLPHVSVVQALECAGNGRRFFEERQGRVAPGTPWRLGAIGVAAWTGVPLREVLLLAGVRESAREVMLEGLDDVRMRRPIPLCKALEEDTLLAFGMNGEELPPDHGFPVRVLVPRWAAVASVKWLGEIFVSEEPLYSPWNTEQPAGARSRGAPGRRTAPSPWLNTAWTAGRGCRRNFSNRISQGRGCAGNSIGRPRRGPMGCASGPRTRGATPNPRTRPGTS